jgi:hypothetical protein
LTSLKLTSARDNPLIPLVKCHELLDALGSFVVLSLLRSRSLLLKLRLLRVFDLALVSRNLGHPLRSVLLASLGLFGCRLRGRRGLDACRDHESRGGAAQSMQDANDLEPIHADLRACFSSTRNGIASLELCMIRMPIRDCASTSAELQR